MAQAIPRTLIEPVLSKAEANPDGICFYTRNAERWQAHTHREFRDDIVRVATALAGLGVGRGDRIGLLGPPSYQWEVSDKAIMYLGAITVGLDGKATAENLGFIVDNTALRGLFIEDVASFERIPAAARATLEFVVFFHDGDPGSNDPRHRRFDELLAGESSGEPAVAQIDPEAVGAIIFTSGTTGRPKGIPLRQRQLSVGFPLMDEIFQGETGHRTVAWVPLYNITGRMMSANNHYMDVAQYVIKDPMALIDTCKQVNPTYIVVLPRILEKVHQGVQQSLARRPAALRAAFKFMLGLRKALPLSGVRALTDRLLVKKVRGAIWGTDMQFLICGSAPVDRAILEFFDALGVPTLEVYGMSELGFLLTMNRPDRKRYGSVGEPLANVRVRLAEDGEVLVRTDAALEHYWGESDTSELFDADGWLKTGDLGEMKEGYLYLKGRKKEIIKTSTGLRIAPVGVENAYKDIAGIDSLVAIGDNRKFLVALVALDPKFAESLREDPVAYLGRELQARHARLPANQQIKRFALLDRPLTIEDGEITPTLKLRRSAIEQKYRERIEALYAED
jgi:long-chain acyl-CoA synthetase